MATRQQDDIIISDIDENLEGSRTCVSISIAYLLIVKEFKQTNKQRLCGDNGALLSYVSMQLRLEMFPATNIDISHSGHFDLSGVTNNIM